MILAAAGGIGFLGLVGIAVPLASALVAIVLLGPQRSKLVGESLGDAVEDLRAELVAMREDRNTFRDERDQARTDLTVCREELRLTKGELRKAKARIADLENPPQSGEPVPTSPASPDR